MSFYIKVKQGFIAQKTRVDRYGNTMTHNVWVDDKRYAFRSLDDIVHVLKTLDARENEYHLEIA